MSTTPKISVIMPVYNSEKYIRDAIESILNQTFADFEFIIDDASTDNSHKIIEEYSKKDKRIVPLRGPKLGLSKSLNEMIKMAKGKYIARMDSDDISIMTRLEIQYNYLEENKDCGVVGSFIELFDHTGNIVGIRKYRGDDTNLRKKIFLYSPIAHPACMIRREVFDNVGYYDTKYVLAEDLDLWFRIGTRYKFANIQEILFRYRIHEKSMTTSKLKEWEYLTLEIRKKYSHGYGYKMSLIDKMYNLSIMITAFIPYEIKISIFNLIRNER